MCNYDKYSDQDFKQLIKGTHLHITFVKVDSLW